MNGVHRGQQFALRGASKDIAFPMNAFLCTLTLRAQLCLSRKQGDANEDQISAIGEGNW